MAEEFQAAFVDPFVAAARRVGFPRQVNWLFVGPTGPHIIGKAARSCARALGSPDVFTVDFDPRWAKKLAAGSFASKRYLEHVDMDNNIIRELAQYLASDSITLRFDYRGVGGSRIDLPVGLSVFDYWTDIEESKNYDDAVSDIACAGDELCRILGNSTRS